MPILLRVCPLPFAFKTGCLLIITALTAACNTPIDRAVHVEGGLANVETQAAAISGMPPVSAFASLPDIDHLHLSPSGNYLAFLQNTGGETVLITRASPGNKGGGEQVHVVLKSDNDKFRIADFTWLGDERLLVSVRYPSRRYGVDSTEGRLLAVSRDASQQPNELFRRDANLFSPSHEERNPFPQFQDQIVALPADDSRHVLLALDLKVPAHPDVYRVDVDSGERTLVQNNWAGITHWLADEKGEVRLGVAMSESPYRILLKRQGGEDWETPSALEKRRKHGDNVHPLGLDGDTLYYAADHHGRLAVFRLDTAQQDAEEQLVAADADYDVEGPLIFGGWPKRPLGVRYTDDTDHAVFWDARAKQAQARIDRALPGRSNRLVSSDRRGRLHVVVSSGPTQPPQYYLLNDDTNRLTLLADTYPKLTASRDRLSEPRAIRFKARDGLDIPGYLTLPKDKSGRNLPTVIFPHGGPWARDNNDFDYWTQLFASRGWAVLKINFRGSAGFGESFERAGFQRWGLEMQDDISDGVAWLRAQGIADPNRICIVGGSYGGYAALTGLAKTPDLFRCGVSFAGVSDLLDLVSFWNNFLHTEGEIERRLGGWWSDHQRLKATSPVALASNIRAPLLIAHGVQDRSVPVEQARDMVVALKDANFRDFKYLELPLADHQLSREEDRLRFFNEMERFLRRYLDKKPETERGR